MARDNPGDEGTDRIQPGLTFRVAGACIATAIIAGSIVGVLMGADLRYYVLLGLIVVAFAGYSCLRVLRR
jgi:hypothetical protein